MPPNCEGLDEAWLVRCAQAGDLRAFDRLARRYRAGATALARKVLRSAEGAEDVAQESLLLAYKHLPRLKQPDRFAAWFAAIVRNRALRVLQNLPAREEPLERHVDRLILRQAPGVTAPSLADEAIEGLQALPDDLLEIANLYYLHDYPVGRISALLGIPATTVKWRLHETRRRLRRNLIRTKEKENGFDID